MPPDHSSARSTALAVVALVLATGIVPAPADAAIRCKESYQIVQGNLIATPYCEDSYLAEVARGYGTRVSAREIRNNPNRKEQVCRLVGGDIRVSDICAQYRSDGGRNKR